MEFDFRTCPSCHGYGILDDGKNCAICGGKGRGGLRSGKIGSGEIIVDKATGRIVSLDEFNRAMGAST